MIMGIKYDSKVQKFMTDTAKMFENIYTLNK